MKPKTVIFLLVVLIACVGYVVVRHTDVFKKARPKEKAADRAVFDAEPNGEKKLTIAGRGAETVVFEKKAGKWRITAPIQAAASAYDVNRVVDLLRDLKAKSSFSPKDPDAVGTEITGLDEPPWTVELVDEDGRAFALQVGRRRPLGARDETYVRVAGEDRVYVVARDFTGPIDKTPKDFRDKTVLDLYTGDIVRLRAEGREVFELEKTDGNWKMVQPTAALADADEVKTILEAVASVEAEQFVADEAASLGRYGLEPGTESAIMRVWVASPPAPATARTTAPAPKPKEYALAFGLLSRDRKQVYARLLDSPAVFLLSASLLDKLQPGLDKLRDMRVLPFDAKAVTRIDLQVPGCKASLMKDPAGWMMAKPYAGRANDKATEELLKKLAALKAQRWADKDEAPPAARGLDPPKGDIKLHRKDQAKPLTLLLGSVSRSGRMTYLMPAGADQVAVVKTAQVKPLLGGPATYWNAELFAMPAAEKVTRIRVKKPGMSSAVFRDEAGAWKMTAPVKGDADTENVKKLISRVRWLKAEKVVLLDAMVPNSYLGDKTLVTAELLTERPGPTPAPATSPASKPATGPATGPATRPGPRPITKTYFVLAVRKDGKCHAWLRGKGVAAIGQFPAGLYEDLCLELRGRQVWRLDPNDVTAFNIIAGQSKADLKREKDGWICPSDRDVKIDGEKVLEFLESIRSLDAERFYTRKAAAGDDDDDKKFAFKTPWLTLALELTGGRRLSLVISNKGLDKTANRFARASSAQGVFLIAAADLAKVSKKLKDFEE